MYGALAGVALGAMMFFANIRFVRFILGKNEKPAAYLTAILILKYIVMIGVFIGMVFISTLDLIICASVTAVCMIGAAIYNSFRVNRGGKNGL